MLQAQELKMVRKWLKDGLVVSRTNPYTKKIRYQTLRNKSKTQTAIKQLNFSKAPVFNIVSHEIDLKVRRKIIKWVIDHVSSHESR